MLRRPSRFASDLLTSCSYRDGAHPYVAAMNVGLGAVGQSQGSIPIVSKALSWMNRGPALITPEQQAEAQAYLNKVGQEIIDDRRARTERRNDFLDMLLFGKDPKTGEAMRDELILSQMSAFLIAGHETTSGLLSFTIIELLQNPETYRKAQDEVDRVVGGNSITRKHVRELKYVYATLQETLRLFPTAPFIGKIAHPHNNDGTAVLGGKYLIEKVPN
jgi:cytochrome P450 / NADPH-cytochrome P450 reductase